MDSRDSHDVERDGGAGSAVLFDARAGRGVGMVGGGRPVALEVDPSVPGRVRAVGEAAGADGGDEGAAAVRTRVQVVLPFYNEASLIRGTFTEVERFGMAHPEYAFLFVDDGSSDDTAGTVRMLISESELPESRLRLISYAPNRGKGWAVRAGVEGATAEVVLFTDGDLAYSMEHLPRLVSALERADVAIGSRSLVEKGERNTTRMRRVMGWTFNKCARLILGLRHKDTQAGLKGFRIGAARAIFGRQRLGGFAFDVELCYLARRLGYRVAEVPAHVSEGHSYKVSKVNLIKDPIRMFGALLDVRRNALLGRYGTR